MIEFDSKAEARVKLRAARVRAARVARWASSLAAVCWLGAIWGWSYGVGAQLLLTGVLLLLVALFSAGVMGQAASLVKEGSGGHQVQVAKGAGNVQVQGRGNVVVHHATGQRMAAGRMEVKPMTERPKSPRKR